LSEQRELSTRRIFHGLERRYLTAEAQSMASCLLNSLSVSPDVPENAIQQAVVLGTLSGSAVDIQTFEALFQAVTLDPLFKIPFSAVNFLSGCNTWVC
jgi:predicted Zn-dependent peptidase